MNRLDGDYPSKADLEIIVHCGAKFLFDQEKCDKYIKDENYRKCKFFSDGGSCLYRVVYRGHNK